jgi:hypothetical protein
MTIRTRLPLLAFLALAACGSDGSTSIDAMPAAPDAVPRVCPATLYLSFEGVVLQLGTEDDAAQNLASWMDPIAPSVTVPRYASGQADRQAQIDAIVTQVTDALDSFDVEVVTQRPAAGPYDMFVFGGAPASFRFPAGVSSAYSYDCDDSVESNVGIVFDDFWPGYSEANLAINFFGVSHGVATTTVDTDCMCSNCLPHAGPCILSGNAPISQGYQKVCGAAPGNQDSEGEFDDRFSCD